MNPTTKLADLRQLVALVHDELIDEASRARHAVRLAEVFQELDEWLSRGNDRPRDWTTDQPPTSLTGAGAPSHESSATPIWLTDGRRRGPRRDDATRPRVLPNLVTEIIAELNTFPTWIEST